MKLVWQLLAVGAVALIGGQAAVVLEGRPWLVLIAGLATSAVAVLAPASSRTRDGRSRPAGISGWMSPMAIHSFHLAQAPLRGAVGALLRPPSAPGLEHLEVLVGMELGAPVVSPRRMQIRHLAVFAEWADEAALEAFLAEQPFGRMLEGGWHVRLEFLRRWGMVRELAHLPVEAVRTDPGEPVVAVTLARMRLPELPRFIRWGRPVERQVRDHPETTLALAAMRPFRTVSTFSVWTSARAMTGMVFGRDEGAAARVHSEAMTERDRRDFHHEFTTLRFRPLSEHGAWNGRSNIVPGAR